MLCQVPFCPEAIFVFAVGCPRGFPECLSSSSQTLWLWRDCGKTFIGIPQLCSYPKHSIWLSGATLLEALISDGRERVESGTTGVSPEKSVMLLEAGLAKGIISNVPSGEEMTQEICDEAAWQSVEARDIIN